jgi:hypothetical protein
MLIYVKNKSLFGNEGKKLFSASCRQALFAFSLVLEAVGTARKLAREDMKTGRP